MVYFVRVNGDTLHNNPNRSSHYVPGEPPSWPTTRFNYMGFCLQHDIVRIGWPDTGDLSAPSKTGALAQGYSLETLKPYVQGYLRGFRGIEVGSLVLMPDAHRPGELYVGEVTMPYHYRHRVPQEPYECAHRVGVRWDGKAEGTPRAYRAEALGINTRGGFWRRAFHTLESSAGSRALIPTLKAARSRLH